MIVARFLLLVLAAASIGSANCETLPGYQVVQMSRGAENHLLVRANLNGKPALFLLDTGADRSWLRADRAGAFGVRSLDQTVRTAGKAFAAGAVADFQTGGAHLGETTFALFPSAELGSPATGELVRNTDGAIGLDLLRRYGAVINCHTRQLFLRTTAASPLDLAGTTAALGFRKVPIITYQRNFLSVPCRLGGRLGRLILDTGAFVTALADDAVRDFRITTVPTHLTARTIDGVVRPIELAEVKDLRIGVVAIAPQTFAVIDFFNSRKPARTFTGINRREYYAEKDIAPGDRIFGLLGNELLDQRQAIIDLASMSLFLK